MKNDLTDVCPTSLAAAEGLRRTLVYRWWVFAVLAGGQLFGFLGILLALPAASALNVLVGYMHRKYRESVLYLRKDGTEEGS